VQAVGTPYGIRGGLRTPGAAGHPAQGERSCGGQRGRFVAGEHRVEEVDGGEVGESRNGDVGQFLGSAGDVERRADLLSCRREEREPVPGDHEPSDAFLTLEANTAHQHAGGRAQRDEDDGDHAMDKRKSRDDAHVDEQKRRHSRTADDQCPPVRQERARYERGQHGEAAEPDRPALGRGDLGNREQHDVDEENGEDAGPAP
jgi:hypothetical protein